MPGAPAIVLGGLIPMAGFSGVHFSSTACFKNVLTSVSLFRLVRGRTLPACFQNHTGVIVTAHDCENLASLLIDRMPDFIPVELLNVFKSLAAC